MKAGSNRYLQPPLPPALLEALKLAKKGGIFAVPCVALMLAFLSFRFSSPSLPWSPWRKTTTP